MSTSVEEVFLIIDRLAIDPSVEWQFEKKEVDNFISGSIPTFVYSLKNAQRKVLGSIILKTYNSKAKITNVKNPDADFTFEKAVGLSLKIHVSIIKGDIAQWKKQCLPLMEACGGKISLQKGELTLSIADLSKEFESLNKPFETCLVSLIPKSSIVEHIYMAASCAKNGLSSQSSVHDKIMKVLTKVNNRSLDENDKKTSIPEKRGASIYFSNTISIQNTGQVSLVNDKNQSCEKREKSLTNG